MKRIVYISLIGLLLSIGCKRQTQASPEVSSIASLRNIETSYRSVLIAENIVVEGTITANDKYREFNNCLIIEDESAALKVLCEVDDSYRTYPFNSRVKISCNGLYLVNHYGSLTLGAEPATDDYTLDYIPQSRIGQYLKASDKKPSPLSPLPVTINELTPLHTFRYIKIRAAQISNKSGASTFCQRDPDTGRTVDTSHTITDPYGSSIELYVDRLCTYADEELPKGECLIGAIIDYYNGGYSATITNMDLTEKSD